MKVDILNALVLAIILVNNVEGKMDFDGVMKMTKPLRAPCIQESGVSPDIVDAGKNGDFADDQGLKCYYKCLIQKLKIIQGGKISLQNLKAQTNALMEDSLAQRVVAATDACESAAFVSEDLCEATFSFFKCCYATDKDIFFFP